MRLSVRQPVSSHKRHDYDAAMIIISPAVDELRRLDYDSVMAQSVADAADLGPGGQQAELLDHYVNSLEWRLPRQVWLDGTSLAWDARPQPGVIVRPGPGMLEGFVRLADRDADAIRDYAGHWGPLWLCGHGLYWQHDRFACRPQPVREEIWYTRWERLADWRDLAVQARATLRIAQKLNGGQLADPSDWQAIPGRYERMDAMFIRWDEAQWVDEHSERLHEASLVDDELEQFEKVATELQAEERSRSDYLSPDEAWQWETVAGGATLDIHERLLAMVLDTWVERGGVKPSVFRHNGRRSIRLGGYGLLGALAIQLVFDVCRSDGLAICTSCGTPYLPARRRPRRDQNPYCPDCGVQAALRDAAARYRRTEKYREARARRIARQQGSDSTPGGSEPDQAG